MDRTTTVVEDGSVVDVGNSWGYGHCDNQPCYILLYEDAHEGRIKCKGVGEGVETSRRLQFSERY